MTSFIAKPLVHRPLLFFKQSLPPPQCFASKKPRTKQMSCEGTGIALWDSSNRQDSGDECPKMLVSQPNQLKLSRGEYRYHDFQRLGVLCDTVNLSLWRIWIITEGRPGEFQLQDSNRILHLGWMREQVCCAPLARYLFSNQYLLRSQHPKVRF